MYRLKYVNIFGYEHSLTCVIVKNKLSSLIVDINSDNCLKEILKQNIIEFTLFKSK